jgi:hypothetical protein
MGTTEIIPANAITGIKGAFACGVWITYDNGKSWSTEASLLRVPPGKSPSHLTCIPRYIGGEWSLQQPPAYTAGWKADNNDNPMSWVAHHYNVKYTIFND